jgi:hypothetical protein
MPKAHIIKWGPVNSKGFRNCSVLCPLCGDIHTHGADEEDYRKGGVVGHRGAHCSSVFSKEKASSPRPEGWGYFLWAFGPNGMLGSDQVD